MMNKITLGRNSLLRYASQALLAVGALMISSGASAVPGDMATFTFNLPSTATSSQTPPYEVVAVLTLVEDATGVIFTLDPNENNSGFSTPTHSRVEQLSLAFELSPTVVGPTGLSWSNVSGGGPVEGIDLITNNQNVDSSYMAVNQYIDIRFFNPNNNDPNVNQRFYVEETSTWRINNVGLAQFTGTQATSGPKPTPIYGVIQVAPISITGLKPTPSKWVSLASTPTMVPEPTSVALLGIGLIGFVLVRRRHTLR